MHSIYLSFAFLELRIFYQGLFKIHTHVTPQGFIFINFDSSPTPIPFEEHFDQLPREWKDTDFTQYE